MLPRSTAGSAAACRHAALLPLLTALLAGLLSGCLPAVDVAGAEDPPLALPSGTAGAEDPPPASPSAPPWDTAGARGLPPVAESWRQLDGLARTDRHPAVPAYRRDAFGSPWADVEGNGCNQRDDVPLRDALPDPPGTVARQGACDHDVLAGAWADPYTGRRLEFDDLKEMRQAMGVQIDHVVPLAEAWASGAWAWDAERRRAYANDLDNLLAVDGPANAAKGADDPAAWRPRQAFQCDYARRWTEVKDRWDLAVDASEARALGEMLGYC